MNILYILILSLFIDNDIFTRPNVADKILETSKILSPSTSSTKTSKLKSSPKLLKDPKISESQTSNLDQKKSSKKTSKTK